MKTIPVQNEAIAAFEEAYEQLQVLPIYFPIEQAQVIRRGGWREECDA